MGWIRQDQSDTDSLFQVSGQDNAKISTKPPDSHKIHVHRIKEKVKHMEPTRKLWSLRLSKQKNRRVVSGIEINEGRDYREVLWPDTSGMELSQEHIIN